MPETRDHGPLPGLLLALTVATGLVDAVSYLVLGHVFVANMTGNVVFFGFALSGVGGVSWSATLLAVGAFGVGAFLGGRRLGGAGTHRGRLLALSAALQCAAVAGAAALAALADPQRRGVQLVLVALLAVAMGMQNAVVRRLAVPDLTTTVLTLTVAGLFADRTPARIRGRRVASVLAMMAGALVGGLLLRHADVAAPLWTAAGLLAVCSAAAHRLGRAPAAELWR
ncbi:YoaK family protein [Kitasatospora sp. NPDC127116]|uniref:YoaK family protein n=1 Tax=Kitasatospora sp. NPDC127116 TaxID=3345367 RepID=UPI003633561D